MSDNGWEFGDMMPLQLVDSLPYVTVRVGYAGRVVEIASVLVDTGSASTVLAADAVVLLGLVPRPDDELRTIRGVGGIETVFTRAVDHLEVGGQHLDGFEVEVAGMDYGFAISGILGMDFLIRSGAVVNLRTMTIEFSGSVDLG